ncbi:MAG: hypothetical protein ABI823_19745 [Bryobacteraceae bacterium]
MSLRIAIGVAVCVLSAIAQPLPQFMGRRVTIDKPAVDDSGMFPEGSATVCVEGPPQRQCFKFPDEIGLDATARIVQVRKGFPALFFSARSGGVSGWRVMFALLRPGQGKELENLFPYECEVSSQSEHAFWSEPSISDALIFVTATYVWGPDESHFVSHRFMISAFLLKRTQEGIAGEKYYLQDRYMTVRKYDVEQDDVLATEKPEILRRLRKVAEYQKTTP